MKIKEYIASIKNFFSYIQDEYTGYRYSTFPFDAQGDFSPEKDLPKEVVYVNAALINETIKFIHEILYNDKKSSVKEKHIPSLEVNPDALNLNIAKKLKEFADILNLIYDKIEDSNLSKNDLHGCSMENLITELNAIRASSTSNSETLFTRSSKLVDEAKNILDFIENKTREANVINNKEIVDYLPIYSTPTYSNMLVSSFKGLFGFMFGSIRNNSNEENNISLYGVYINKH